MTNPALEVPTDEPIQTPEDVSADAAESFLADFDSTILGKESSISDEPAERSSAPTPDAAEPSQADAPKGDARQDADGDPDQPASTPDADTPQYLPLTYTVNGQQKTADWALQVGDEGVVIPQQHIARFKDLIQRDEWQNAQNRELYKKAQEYDGITHKMGESEYRGMEAIRQMQADVARLDASGGRILQALADPDFVTNLAIAYQNGNQQEVQSAIAKMLEQVRFVGEKAQFDTLKSLSERTQEAARTEEQTQVQETEYRDIIAQFGRALPDLNTDDLRAMYQHFGVFRDKIFRPASLAEAQQLGVRPGTIIKDPTVMYEWAQDRAALRKRMVESTAAAQHAAKENAARQSAQRPAKGRTKPAVSAKPPAKKQDALFDGDDGSYAAWQKRLMAGRWAHDDRSSET